MASRKARAPPPESSRMPSNVSIPDALSKLGMTHEQFQAKQAELLEVLLQNRPFVPHTSNARYIPLYEKAKLGHLQGNHSRSSSLSSTSSRAASPVLPHTPARPDYTDPPPPRPRDQMELVLEERSRRKNSHGKDSTSRSREIGRVLSTPNRSTTGFPTADSPLPPETPHHYRYYSERVVGEASSSKRPVSTSDQPETPSRSRDREHSKVPPFRYPIPSTPSRKKHGTFCPATPRSSPPPVVNLVSSPGPMRPDPPGDDKLPYVLPPGPYSEVKPELSYAAIIGRAILASSLHALALQDIYEYITTVFPYYKRGEPTWMNSVRHALSTMAVFRKVQRGRAEGKSLWAIYDSDIPCFDGGGFKKSLCADMNNGTSRASKKRSADEGGNPRSKRKKTRDDKDASQAPIPAPILPPFFPPFSTSNPHHQPYYQAACMKQQPQLPAETLFPPLPPSSNYHRVLARATMSVAAPAPAEFGEEVERDVFIPSSSPIERPPSSSSLPDLVSSLSTSSSPSPSSRLSLHEDVSRSASPETASFPTMDPMAEWFSSDSPLREMSPPATTQFNGKGKARASPHLSERKYPRMMAPMLPPSSPTPQRRNVLSPRRSSGTPPATVVKRMPSTTESVAAVMRALEHAIEARSLSPSASLQPFTAVASSDRLDVQERPSTPVRPVTPPLPSTPPRYPSTPSRFGNPSTPSRYELPSTPSRLDKLEAELFNFSPCRSSADILSHSTGLSALHSPSLSIFTSRASGSMDDLLPSGFTPSKPRTLAAVPKTPKKTPPSRASVSMRIVSPFGTPSRSIRDSVAEFDDDFARYLQSPRNVYDSMVASLSGAANPSGLESPSYGW